MHIYSFAPVADEYSRLLILGSMPSETSLVQGRYYGHPRNRFWPLLFRIYDEPLAQDYAARLDFLHRRKIALWDSCFSCRRQGSQDANIREESPNDIPGLLRAYPDIQKIIFNGKAAETIFFRHFGPPERPYISLPSTSPIPRPGIRNIDDLFAAWAPVFSQDE